MLAECKPIISINAKEKAFDKIHFLFMIRIQQTLGWKLTTKEETRTNQCKAASGRQPHNTWATLWKQGGGWN